MAIGARRADVLRLVLRQGIVTASVGLAIGFALGAATTRLTVTLLYGVSSSDPISYGAAFVALAAVSLIAALLPAREIARVDPVVALRQTWLAFVANSHLSINASRGDRPVARSATNGILSQCNLPVCNLLFCVTLMPHLSYDFVRLPGDRPVAPTTSHINGLLKNPR